MVYQKKSIETSLNYGAKKSIFEKAEMLRRKMTDPEKKLWGCVKDNQLKGYKIRRQHPIDVYVVDFYCHKAKLVIEIDGENHSLKEVREKDQSRTAELNELGLKVIRFTNSEVMDNIDDVLNIISQNLP
ncbi:MAG: endonuclease domain-containing protein [Bacteroidetes bacterium]|nr:endonuclease domain-containing protein [Bacteroidota bacterium]